MHISGSICEECSRQDSLRKETHPERVQHQPMGWNARQNNTEKGWSEHKASALCLASADTISMDSYLKPLSASLSNNETT